MYGNLSKCKFYTPVVHYLGHIISSKGLVVDPKNIIAVRDWPTQKYVNEVSSCMDLARYYRKFVKKNYKIAYPINQL